MQVVDTALGAPPVGGASIGGASSSSGAASSAPVVILPSALEPTTAELVKTLFDTDMFKTAMAEIKGTFEIDTTFAESVSSYECLLLFSNSLLSLPLQFSRIFTHTLLCCRFDSALPTVDVTKLPLGMISEAQLQRGQDLLAQLQTLLKVRLILFNSVCIF
jgi:hypothetical protein